jgi:hypothetical protein
MKIGTKGIGEVVDDAGGGSGFDTAETIQTLLDKGVQPPITDTDIVPSVSKLYGVDDKVSVSDVSLVAGAETSAGSVQLPNFILRGSIVADSGSDLIVFGQNKLLRKLSYSYDILIQTTAPEVSVDTPRAMYADNQYVFICESRAITVYNKSDLSFNSRITLHASYDSRSYVYKHNKIYGCWGTSAAQSNIWIFDCSALTITTKATNTISGMTSNYANSVSVDDDNVYMYVASSTYVFKLLMNGWAASGTYSGHSNFNNIVHYKNTSNVDMVFATRASSPYRVLITASSMAMSSSGTLTNTGMGNANILKSIGQSVYSMNTNYYLAIIAGTGNWVSNSYQANGCFSQDNAYLFSVANSSYLVARYARNTTSPVIDGKTASSYSYLSNDKALLIYSSNENKTIYFDLLTRTYTIYPYRLSIGSELLGFDSQFIWRKDTPNSLSKLDLTTGSVLFSQSIDTSGFSDSTCHFVKCKNADSIAVLANLSQEAYVGTLNSNDLSFEMSMRTTDYRMSVYSISNAVYAKNVIGLGEVMAFAADYNYFYITFSGMDPQVQQLYFSVPYPSNVSVVENRLLFAVEDSNYAITTYDRSKTATLPFVIGSTLGDLIIDNVRTVMTIDLIILMNLIINTLYSKENSYSIDLGQGVISFCSITFNSYRINRLLEA